MANVETIPTTDDTAPTAGPVRQGILALAEKAREPVHGNTARRLIEKLISATGIDRAQLRDFWASPAENLGEFRQLPERLQQELRRSAGFYFRELNLLTSDEVRQLAHGNLIDLGGRLVAAGWSAPAGIRSAAVRSLSRVGRKLIATRRRQAQQRLERDRFTERYQMPILYALWTYSGCDVASIIETYVSEIPADKRLSPVVRDARQNNDSCLIIGMDALMHQGAPVLLETNMNPGFKDRVRLYPAGDPVCQRLLRYAKDRGLSRIAFFSYNGPPRDLTMQAFPAELEQSWAQMAVAQGVSLYVVDSPQYGAPGRRRSSYFPDTSSSDTLFAYAKDVPSAISQTIGTKGRVDEHINVYNRSAAPGDEVRLPRKISRATDIPPMDQDSRFPNLIVKKKNVDNARGISLYRTDRIPEKAPEDLLYEYVVPDLERCDGPEGQADYAYSMRLYVMLTPDGPRYLGARKDISSVAVPEKLPMGAVDNILPYIANGSLNAYYVPPSPSEVAIGEAFALKVGACLQRLLADKYGQIR